MGLPTTVVLLALFAGPAAAQWIVFDPTNYAQNVLTAARELQQVDNGIQALTNQAQMLVNQAKNLTSLPLSTLTQLESSVQQTEGLISQAQNIAFNVQPVEQAFTMLRVDDYSVARKGAGTGYRTSSHVSERKH